MRQAVFGNVGTIISFRTGHSDAEVISKELGNAYSSTTIADLDRYEVVVKLLANGANLESFRGKDSSADRESYGTQGEAGNSFAGAIRYAA